MADAEKSFFKFKFFKFKIFKLTKKFFKLTKNLQVDKKQKRASLAWCRKSRCVSLGSSAALCCSPNCDKRTCAPPARPTHHTLLPGYRAPIPYHAV